MDSTNFVRLLPHGVMTNDYFWFGLCCRNNCSNFDYKGSIEMNLIKQGPGQCLPASLAMLLNVSLETVIGSLGHDGQEILWPEFKPPKCYRGFTIPEMMDISLRQGYALLEVSSMLYQFSGVGDTGIEHSLPMRFNNHEYDSPESRILFYMQRYSGIVQGYYALDVPHACAWNHTEREMYDPNDPRKYNWDEEPNAISIEAFYPLIRIQE